MCAFIFTFIYWLVHCESMMGSTDDGEIKIFIYKGIQPQALQLAGGLLPRHGGIGPVYYKVYFDRNWCVDTFYLLRDLHEDVLVCRVSLLQPGLAFYCCNLGNTCLQPYPWFGQVMQHFLYYTWEKWNSIISKDSAWWHTKFYIILFLHVYDYSVVVLYLVAWFGTLIKSNKTQTCFVSW